MGFYLDDNSPFNASQERLVANLVLGIALETAMLPRQSQSAALEILHSTGIQHRSTSATRCLDGCQD